MVKESVISVGTDEGTVSVVVRRAMLEGSNHTTKKSPAVPLPFVPVTVTHATGVFPGVKIVTDPEQSTASDICRLAEVTLIASVKVVWAWEVEPVAVR